MKKALLVLDLEKAFMNEDIKEVSRQIEDYIASTYYDEIIVGKFVNQEDSVFVKRLGETYCLDKREQALSVQISKPFVVMERTAYTMYTEELEEYLQEHQIKYIYLCGIDTDRSIYKTAIDLLEREYYVYVIEHLCASSAGEVYHEMGIRLLERQIGKDYVI